MTDFESRKEKYLNRFLSNKRIVSSVVNAKSNGAAEIGTFFKPENEFQLTVVDAVTKLAQVAIAIETNGSGMDSDALINGAFVDCYTRLISSTIKENENEFNVTLKSLSDPDTYAEILYEWFGLTLGYKLEDAMISIACQNGFDPWNAESAEKFNEIWDRIWEQADLGNVSLILFRGKTENEIQLETLKIFVEKVQQIYNKHHSYGKKILD